MGAIGTNGIIDIVDILGSTVADNGAPLLHIGDVRADEGIDENVPHFQTIGLVSIPAASDPGKSAGEALVIKNGGIDWAFASRDVRGLAIAGNLKVGETCVYAAVGAARTLHKNDGRVISYTTDDNTDQGHSVYASVETTGFVRACPWGRETFDSNGFHVNHASGARIDLGGVSGVPAPLSSLNSYAALSAQMIRIEGTSISLGTRVGLPEAVTKAGQLTLYLAGIEAILTTLAAAIDAKLPASAGVTAGAVATALAALQTLKLSMASSTTVTT